MIRYIILVQMLKYEQELINMKSITVYLTKNIPTTLTINTNIEVLCNDRIWKPAKITYINSNYITVKYHTGFIEDISIKELENYDTNIPLIRVII